MSLMNNGVTQWKFQRFANVVCIIAAAVLVCMLFCDSVASLADLKALFAPIWVKLAFAFALLVACMNSVLAGWQIAGDYAAKVNLPESVFTGLAVIVSGVYFLYGLKLLFS